MNDNHRGDDIEARARRRVGLKLGFFTHATIYVLVNLGLFAINAVRGGEHWAIWPLAGWEAAISAAERAFWFATIFLWMASTAANSLASFSLPAPAASSFLRTVNFWSSGHGAPAAIQLAIVSVISAASGPPFLGGGIKRSSSAGTTIQVNTVLLPGTPGTMPGPLSPPLMRCPNNSSNLSTLKVNCLN